MSTLDQIIADIESGKVNTPETQFVEKVASTTENQVNEELLELRKFAASIDEQARKFAQVYADELSKIAVGVGPMTPNTGAVPDNPAVQVSNADAREADVAKVESIIKKLTLGGEAKVNPAGVIHENNTPVASTQPIVVDEHPVSADVKKANAQVIEALYNKYFN